MRRLSVEELQPGHVVGTSVKVPSAHPEVQYQLKLEPGTTVTQDHIRLLKKLNISHIPVKDADTDDLSSYVSDEELSEAQEKVAEEFSDLADEFEDNTIGSEDINRLRSAVGSLIEALKNSEVMAAFTTLKTHDSYTAQHSLDVAKIAIQLALENDQVMKQRLDSESGASSGYIYENMLEDLGMGAMLHDLGKRDVSKNVLNKSDELNDDEWNEMKSHTNKGYKALGEVEHQLRAPVKVPALQHHEKFDGTGYPGGREGKDIHLFARLCAPADVYSALTSSRPYRGAKSPATALDIMESMQQDGPHFDPDIYDRFRKLVFPYPVGQDVTLSDGSQGVICDVDEQQPANPPFASSNGTVNVSINPWN